jgi:DNA-binding GntR family transcriptional regulator
MSASRRRSSPPPGLAGSEQGRPRLHRTIVEASGNDIVAKLWEALARHVLIVFGREVRSERAGPRLVEQHARLRDLLAAGDLQALLHEIEPHILRLRPGTTS